MFEIAFHPSLSLLVGRLLIFNFSVKTNATLAFLAAVCAIAAIVKFDINFRFAQDVYRCFDCYINLFSIHISSLQYYSVLSTIAQVLRKMSLKILAS